MASIIKLKRSSTQSAVPGSLELGEIAVNLFDRRLYVGNSTGVTAVGGEAFKLTSDTVTTSGDGAYIKLLGETTPSTNSIALLAGEGLDVTLEANGSITFGGEDATTSNKGIASFSTDNFSVSSGAVTIKDGGVVNAELANKTITNAKIADGTINAALIATNGLTANTYGAKSIGTAAIADGAITSAKIAADTITANAIATGAVTSTEILDKTIVAGDIADGTITSTQLAASAITANAVGNDSVALGTKTTGNYVATISGTANEISVSGSGSETAAVTIGLPDDVTITAQLNVGENIVATGNTSVGGNLSVTGDATIDGNLTVEGAVTYISSSTVNVDDSMLKLSANNAGDTVDTGVYGKYVVTGNSAVQFAGYFRDATDGAFKFYTGLDVEPTTTVDTTDTGYGLAQVDAIIDGGTY